MCVNITSIPWKLCHRKTTIYKSQNYLMVIVSMFMGGGGGGGGGGNECVNQQNEHFNVCMHNSPA